jgi:hypothetical protein
MNEPFIITEGEKLQPLWLKLHGHYKQRLVDLHGQLEGDLDEGKTALLRGRIAEVKALLALNESRPVVPTSDYERV